jgi:branched-chain amino acid transport system ATP-binding protein
MARSLSGGEQQMLAIARAIMSDPVLLMLDEPSMGLALLVKESIASSIVEITKAGGTILLVEQDAGMAMDISKKIYLLENGRIRLEGTAEEMADNPHVKEAYLGIA